MAKKEKKSLIMLDLASIIISIILLFFIGTLIINNNELGARLIFIGFQLIIAAFNISSICNFISDKNIKINVNVKDKKLKTKKA